MVFIRARSPRDGAFFRNIDLRQLVRAVEEPFHIIQQETLRFRVREIEAVMIDDPSLGLQPFGPARLTNFLPDFLTELSRQRRESQWRPLLPTTGAFDRI